MQLKSCGFSRSRPLGAFTLLEIVLFIAIVALMVGALVPMMSGSWHDHTLRETGAKLELFARTARSAAVLHGQPSTIKFTTKGFTLFRAEPIASNAAPLDESALLAAEFETNPLEEESESKGDYFPFPVNTHIQIRHWAASAWLKPEKTELWVFRSSGLCEPLAVRLSSGESWIELEFSPLTAEVRNESYAFQ